jgi:hypothetical protein
VQPLLAQEAERNEQILLPLHRVAHVRHVHQHRGTAGLRKRRGESLRQALVEASDVQAVVDDADAVARDVLLFDEHRPDGIRIGDHVIGRARGLGIDHPPQLTVPVREVQPSHHHLAARELRRRDHHQGGVEVVDVDQVRLLRFQPLRGAQDRAGGADPHERAVERKRGGRVPEFRELPHQGAGRLEHAHPDVIGRGEPAQQLEDLDLGSPDVEGADELDQTYRTLRPVSPRHAAPPSGRPSVWAG